MNNQPLLSLCIPTNGAVDWVLPVINSIYSQGYDNDKFEVVITDNGIDSQLSTEIKKMQLSNLRYIQTKEEGFLNLVACLKEGRGLFCKMINHRSVLLPGSIATIVSIIERYRDIKPIIYCADARLASNKSHIECKNLDEFLYHLHYWSSWSAGIGFWKTDIDLIDNVKLDSMFPNVSLLFEIRQNSKYVIWNKAYQNMCDDAGKGGYDLFKTFAVNFLDIINNLRIRRRISDQTFLYVKDKLFGFLCEQYLHEFILPTKHTFIIKDIKQSMEIYYGSALYTKMRFIGWMKVPKIYIFSFLGRFKRLIKL